MDQWKWVTESLGKFRPELILLGAVVVLVLVEVVSRRNRKILATLAILAIICALGFCIYDFSTHTQQTQPELNFKQPETIFKGSAAFDGLALFFKNLFLIGALFVAIFSIPVLSKWVTGYAEFWILLISCIFGMLLMSEANDLLMMYLSLEFVSVTSYILTGLLRKDRKSAEASLKYIIYGSAASGVMLFGMTYLYGITGSLNVTEIGKRLGEVTAGQGINVTMALVTSVLIMAGFAYKIAAVPFHMWCPDVYEGAPTPVTTFFSIGPKIAGFAMLVRFLNGVFPKGPGDEAFEWKIIIAVLSLVTMTVGNISALHQSNLKRLLAYSGIAHAGYMLLPFLIFTQDNISSLMFYSAVYLVMNLGAFFVVIVLEEKYGIQTVEDCKGLGWVDPKLCGVMTIFLFSLTGIPPLAGFMGKFLILRYLVVPGNPIGTLGILMAIFAVLFTVISLYYYARIIAKMFLEHSSDKPQAKLPLIFSSCLWILALATIALGIFWNPLYGVIMPAAKNIAG